MTGKKRATGIPCPICGREMSVTETRSGDNFIRRRRACTDYKCSGKVVTVEVVHVGARVSGVVMLDADEVEQMMHLLSRAIVRPKRSTDDDDEAVSPSK